MARALRATARVGLEGHGTARLALRADLTVSELTLDGEPLARAPSREGGMQVWRLELRRGAVHHLVLRYAGTLAAGVLEVGSHVTVLPVGKTTRVAGIDRFDQRLAAAESGERDS